MEDKMVQLTGKTLSTLMNRKEPSESLSDVIERLLEQESALAEQHEKLRKLKRVRELRENYRPLRICGRRRRFSIWKGEKGGRFLWGNDHPITLTCSLGVIEWRQK